MKKISSYEIDPSDLKINNINDFEDVLHEVKHEYLYLKDDGNPNLLRYPQEDNCLQEVDSKLQEIWYSMTRSLEESKQYASKQGSDLYQEATNNLNSLNSLKGSFDKKKYTTSKLAENISQADKLFYSSEGVMHSFVRFENMIEQTQETFKEMIDRFVFSFNEYLTVCHLQNFSSEYQELESINLEISKLNASAPGLEHVDKAGLMEVKDQKVFASSLLVIVISLLGLIVSGLIMGVGDIEEAFWSIFTSIFLIVVAFILVASENPWGIFIGLVSVFGFYQAFTLSPFLLILLPAIFIVPWLIIKGKKDAEDEFESTLADEQKAIVKKYKDQKSKWKKELADLKKKADDKTSTLKSKLVSSLMQQPDLSYLGQKDDKRLERLTETLTDFNELIKSYAGLEADILNINNEYKTLLSWNVKLDKKFRSWQNSWASHS